VLKSHGTSRVVVPRDGSPVGRPTGPFETGWNCILFFSDNNTKKCWNHRKSYVTVRLNSPDSLHVFDFQLKNCPFYPISVWYLTWNGTKRFDIAWNLTQSKHRPGNDRRDVLSSLHKQNDIFNHYLRIICSCHCQRWSISIASRALWAQVGFWDLKAF
jgi:hypothetical protein